MWTSRTLWGSPWGVTFEAFELAHVLLQQNLEADSQRNCWAWLAWSRDSSKTWQCWVVPRREVRKGTAGLPATLTAAGGAAGKGVKGVLGRKRGRRCGRLRVGRDPPYGRGVEGGPQH